MSEKRQDASSALYIMYCESCSKSFRGSILFKVGICGTVVHVLAAHTVQGGSDADMAIIQPEDNMPGTVNFPHLIIHIVQIAADTNT